MKNAEFVTTATAPEHYPKVDHPQIAVAGRSNVGKSSLLNLLFNRKSLVKTSSTPGKTREVQFFAAEDILFVDLPGYGYAKCGRNFAPMIETYFETAKPNLLLILLDIRHDPTAADKQLAEWAKGQNIAIIFTKADKIGPSKRQAQANKICRQLGLTDAPHVITSATKRTGRDQLIAMIKRIL